jgi:hypothetical protein
MALPGPLTNILFPPPTGEGGSPNLSMVTTQATVLDVCYSVYGESTLSTDDVDSFYETSASRSYIQLSRKIWRLTHCSSVSSYRPDRCEDRSDIRIKVMKILSLQLPHALSLVTSPDYLANLAQSKCRDHSR